VKLLDYLPEMLREIYEFQAICSAGDNELDKLKDELAAAVDDNFVYTLSESGCARWEKMLSLTPKATDTIADRRFRILTKLNHNLPYTMRCLEQLLEMYCGEDNFRVVTNFDVYALRIETHFTVYSLLCELRKTLNAMIPANISLDSFNSIVPEKGDPVTAYAAVKVCGISRRIQSSVTSTDGSLYEMRARIGAGLAVGGMRKRIQTEVT
jgi:hypothetical protein